MSYGSEIASMFRKRDNEIPAENVIGTVISTSPLTISIYEGSGILTGDIIYVCESLREIKGNVTLDNVADHGSVTTNFKITRELKEQDRVMCVPTDGGSKYFIVDKVV
ncbi:TPA: DUF2577 domain-containing protein [Clostridium botulinum]|nr:DUF2577 domain-containing protein [Clostridium botulinum]